jgi:sigma-B regulation protein RsbU (phosphoserine phosphatase)
METEHYFTLLLADVDLDTGRLVFVQAGHPHPIIQRANGRLEQVGQGGLPIGLIEGATFEQFECTLARGDRILVQSDGITECEDGQGRLLGEDGLMQMMSDLAKTRGSPFLEGLLWKLGDLSGGDEFADDISAVLLEF